MSFATPTALLLAGLALPIILLYILKVRLRRVNVSTNLFWKQIYEEKPPRSIWQYFRHLLSLLLQLLLLGLLVCSVADPFFPWQLLQSRRVVVIIDNSASMQADDISPTRFDAAIESANTLVDGLRFRDQMAIVLSGPRPEVVLGMSSHVPTLKRALQDLQVSDNPTELTTAIALGNKLIGEHPRGQVVVFTDGCDVKLAESMSLTTALAATETLSQAESTQAAEQPQAAQAAQAPPAVDYRIFGTNTGNVGITQFQVRRSLIDPIGYEVLVAVHNASDEGVSCRLELELDEAPIDIVPLTLEPNEHWSRSLEKTSLEGGQLMGRLTEFQPADPSATGELKATAELSPTAELSSTAEPGELNPPTSETVAQTAPETAIRLHLNSLKSDDTATAILPARAIQKVLVVTKGNLFLRKVFEANPLVDVEVMPDFPDTWPVNTIIVLDREIPATLPPGNVFVVDPDASCDLWDLGEPLRDPIVTEQDTDSQLMKHVRLDNVLMPEARKITLKGKSHILAGSLSNDPVYAEVAKDSGKCLVLTVNLENSDLAFRTAFPIMVTNSLGWFAGASGELLQASASGSVLAFEVEQPAAGNTLILRSPSGQETPVAHPSATDLATESPADLANGAVADSTKVSLGPFHECGLWSLIEKNSEAAGSNPDEWVENSLSQFAVNLSDARESDLRPSDELLDKKIVTPMLAGLFARPIWFYLVGLGCLISVTEWFLYQRRVIS